MPLTKSVVRDIARYDLPASLVVFLVALPLSLGIAIASGAPLMAGLIAAVVGGVVVGAFGGSPLQVSGPAAGLTVVVAGLVQSVGWQVTCLITVGAGLLQIVFGLSRIAQAALAIAPIVVHAMLAGIGITIALQQVHVLLGGTSASSAWANLVALPQQLTHIHSPDLLVGAIVIAVLLAWPRLPARVRKVPGPLVAIVAATVVAVIFPIGAERIAIDGSFFDALTLPALPDGNWGAVALGVLTVALIASVESLLSAVAVDKMHSGPRTDFNRELIGQGGANALSGLIGGLPVTGVIVRSTANVNAGARTRASAILHGVWILLFAVVLTGLVQQIPKAALAGLLVVIGIQLVKLAHMKLARRTGDLGVYMITLVAVVFLNLLEGVAIGLLVAIAVVLWRVVRAEVHAEPFGTEGSRQWRVTIAGSLSFLALPRLHKALSAVPPQAHVTISLDTDFVDHAASEMIEDWTRAHTDNGGTVVIEETGSARLEHAPTAPPKRHTATRVAGVAPWKSWQGGQRPEPGVQTGESVGRGIEHYHRTVAGDLLPHVRPLADTQNPEILFLTCADSRIVPNVITSSGPGDLFTIRNVGNLVPVDTGADVSVDAALEFAVGSLGVASIVVCGHSACGAMKALLGSADEPAGDDSPLSSWLAHARPSLHAFESGDPAQEAAARAGYDEVDQLGIVNVAEQMRNLATHSLLAERVTAGELRITGLFFDIASAQVIQILPDGPVTAAPAHTL
ncbi:carbonic anhydrase [Tsukamurella ocularis]|nr:bifunctional SulP family inorganic anion transporter/carbonic anhydrase [Tsukamurella ocularis]MCS3851928.1 carbonic anhydrase [Tsukamurella ocularis]